MNDPEFFNRDISWLSFNARVLEEAARPAVPLMERIRFLSIYSSNLDEFYRVRIPALRALQKINKEDNAVSVYRQADLIINGQLQLFGKIFTGDIIPALAEQGYILINKGNIPLQVQQKAADYFFNQVAGLLQPVKITADTTFFPENNQLYLLVIIEDAGGREEIALVNIPCGLLPRFQLFEDGGERYIVFLEDIIRSQLPALFTGSTITSAFNIKITRDAELDLEDEYEENLAEKIEKQLVKRDFGFATRFLYEPGLPLRHLQYVADIFNLHKASAVEGGHHHNLKDLAGIPIKSEHFVYPPWPSLKRHFTGNSLFNVVEQKDCMVHPPYQSYDTVLRFFNEAAISSSVEEIATTLYRVADDSRIVQALISASRNGKKVTVLVELKARFDEANNIRWAKKMKANGIRIMYSTNSIKVHAKIALIKRKSSSTPLLGLLATGNLNESTARFYTDHILLTAHQPMLSEMSALFEFLAKKKKPDLSDIPVPQHLLIAQFNLQQQFLQNIQQEIDNAKAGFPSGIIIKMNNLEEEVLIRKLYEASNAGVPIELIVRGICRLVPGIEGQSENIKVRRIVDRYLEHGRVFIFKNKGDEKIYLGSADWMNRNIYRRIEVCFPVYDPGLKDQLKEIIGLQLKDNVQATWINNAMNNEAVFDGGPPLRSQEAIYRYLQNT
ncbi:MAG: polyphosphate kinase 1 [Ferruginibacter sp.]